MSLNFQFFTLNEWKQVVVRMALTVKESLHVGCISSSLLVLFLLCLLLLCEVKFKRPERTLNCFFFFSASAFVIQREICFTLLRTQMALLVIN